MCAPCFLPVLSHSFTPQGFFSHLFACALYAVADCSNGGECWIESYCVGKGAWFDDDAAGAEPGACLADQDNSVKYLVSLYWAFTTMTTIGYGDITPNARATPEIVVTIVTEVMGTTIFAYVVGALVGIIVNFNPGAKMRKQNMQFLNQ